MGVKFFGQYLIEQGEIDAVELRAALDLMRSHNRQLAEIAVYKRYLGRAQAERISLLQRTTGRSFCELGLEAGLLTQRQVDELGVVERETRLFVGEALVEFRSLPADRLPGLLDRFKLDQAPFETQSRSLDPELEENPAAHLVLDLLPKLCVRMADLPAKMGLGQPLCKMASYPFNVGLTIQGSPSLVVILVSDDRFARELVSSLSGIGAGRLTSALIYDGLGEFLNVLCGNAVAVLERDGILTRLDPPTHDCEISAGIGFELVVGDGCASVILASS